MKQTEITVDGKTELNDGTNRRNRSPELTAGTGMNRREFLRDAGRLLLLAGLAGAAAKLIAGNQAIAPGRDCWNGTACGGCPQRPGCRQLGAMKYKANHKT